MDAGRGAEECMARMGGLLLHHGVTFRFKIGKVGRGGAAAAAGRWAGGGGARTDHGDDEGDEESVAHGDDGDGEGGEDFL
jgi:hypothetical protein